MIIRNIFKNKCIVLSLSLLILIFLVSACTGGSGQNVTNVVQQLPAVQQFFSQYPNANIKVIYYDTNYVNQTILQIRQDCGSQMKVEEYYKADIIDSTTNLILTVWLDSSLNPVCTIKTGVPPQNISSSTSNVINSSASNVSTINTGTPPQNSSSSTSNVSTTINSQPKIVPSPKICSPEYNLDLGQQKTYTFSNWMYDIELSYIDSTSTKFLINGGTTSRISKGNSEILPDGSKITVSDIDSTNNQASFCMDVTNVNVCTPSYDIDGGQPTMYTIDGKVYDVEATYISSSDVEFLINGEKTSKLTKGSNYILGNGAKVTVSDIDSINNQASFCMDTSGISLCSPQYDLILGQQQIYTVHNNLYDVEVSYVDSTSVEFLINGGFTSRISKGNSEALPDGSNVIVAEIDATNNIATFCID